MGYVLIENQSQLQQLSLTIHIKLYLPIDGIQN